MRDLTQLPVLTPELLLGSGPLPAPPPGPVRFTVNAEEENARPTVLRECFARLGFKYDFGRLKDSPVQCDMALNLLPGLLMASGHTPGLRVSRTRSHVEDGTDDAELIVSLRGQHLIEQSNREIVLGDGEAVFISAADPAVDTCKPPGETLVFRFPKASLAPLVRGANDRFMQMIPNGAPALGFLKKYVAFAFDEQTHASRQMQHLVTSHIYELMALMVGATPDAAAAAELGGLRAARLNAIKQDIAKNLDQTELSVAALAARHHCTPRFVQRLFETEGTTFTEYVLAQRLARARRRLTDPRSDGEKISAVAYDCGFGDVSYFNRVFRRQYGATPSDLRAQAQQDAPESRPADNANVIPLSAARSR
jgi:AraC-like DNA-binding protein